MAKSAFTEIPNAGGVNLVLTRMAYSSSSAQITIAGGTAGIWVPTGISVTITPSAADKYIYVTGSFVSSNSQYPNTFRLVRGVTAVSIGTGAVGTTLNYGSMLPSVGTAMEYGATFSIKAYDLPAVTTPVTYSLQASGAANASYVNTNNGAPFTIGGITQLAAFEIQPDA
tara:strand:+ start:298 stop:807 length:510 start_codon:yes stop_codon:yes gene_type:complete